MSTIFEKKVFGTTNHNNCILWYKTQTNLSSLGLYHIDKKLVYSHSFIIYNLLDSYDI